ncbi:dual specificity protein kinase splA [Melitaea cinxia]|uniref:dual specificity protein kinase splA n=1 Tax=Melitaea cinxia TaxID=113334 RepID=UPI001E26FF23|nr:dual specificity protein kinase splA [Melitaea cinxia]
MNENNNVKRLNLYFQICRFCWNRIREGENGLCPACRKAYPENPADFTPLSQEQVAAIKTEKKAREQKRRNKTLESRRALANVRVVQNNLVFVVGLPVRLADPEILKRQEYFGKYGKIHKVVINQSTAYAGSQGPSASAYVTYVSPADALRAIQGVNNVTLDGRVLKGSLGTTKYCANFMKNTPCPKPDCMYLHELGDPKASFTKEEMHAGLHQVYERRLHQQLLQQQRDCRTAQPDERSDGNSSTNTEKGNSKDGNQSNFIPTTVITSSQINVVSTSKSKKESVNGNGNTNSSSSNSSNSSNSTNSKEAWPSLGTSPPSDSPARKQNSPKPHIVKSQENGTSESLSPTQLQSQQSQTKHSKDHTESKPNRSNKDSNTNGQPNKKSKSESKSKQKNSNSNTNEKSETETVESKPEQNSPSLQTQQNSVFENDSQSYLSNELDELESDRHSLLENHDLLDNSDHSLLDDDNTHNLLNDANNEVMMMQRHREMLAGLVDNNHLLPQMKSPLVNGYGLLDRDTMSYLGNDRQISQINHGLMDQKDMLLRERSRSNLLMRQNEMLARQHNVMVEPKHYVPNSSIGLESASELLGANYHPNHNMLPFGMRVDNSMGSSSLGNTMTNTLTANSLSNPISANTGFMLHNQQMAQMQSPQMPSGLVNGFESPQTSEGRYQAENMDKFFTDFHKAQQMRLLLARDERRLDMLPPHAMLSAERLEMEHKQRMNNMRTSDVSGPSESAAASGDDDLDFDPFKETQKALAELMETEVMLNTISSGDNMDRVRRSRLPPPGFSHMNAFGIGVPRHQTHHQGYNNSNTAMFSDWTQMDPAIMSTSVNFGKAPPAQGSLNQQQQELFARFNHLQVQPNGKVPQWPKLWPQHGTPYNTIPLPPGFAPAKNAQHPAECIDAK